jgi:insulin-like growth factor 2 mRNA-binding protein 1
VGSIEKAITIYGQPENCTTACHQIMKVMQEEAKNTGKPEDMPLKLLAHNNLVGRIIGKQVNYLYKPSTMGAILS